MSGSYASRLKYYPNKGKCGLPETFDSDRALKVKLKKLYDLLKESAKTVVLTGAGISTAAGVPDFRGPKGIWTEEMKRKRDTRKEARNEMIKTQTNKNKKVKVNSSESFIDGCFSDENKFSSDYKRSSDKEKNEFSSATPTLTHRAILSLIEHDIVHHCITQNVDGLHQKSGVSRKNLNVLHGCIFTEKCEDCGEEYFRDFEIGGISFQKTGRKCSRKIEKGNVCNGYLRDTLLDWDDDLPEEDWSEACEKCEDADLVIALGTSLRIEPAGSLPATAHKFVIVNLQETPKDKEANCALIIRAKVDDVMTDLMSKLGILTTTI